MTVPEIPAPLHLLQREIPDEWVDHNRHMSLARYADAFLEATVKLSEFLGFTREFKDRTHTASFAAQMHIGYVREVRGGDIVRFESRIHAFDAKRVHFWHEMHHTTKDYLAATCEILSLNIDTRERRVTPMPDEALDRIAAVCAAHQHLPVPTGLGRTIQIDR